MANLVEEDSRTDSRTAEKAPAAPKRSRLWIVFVLLLLIAGAAAAAWWHYRDQVSSDDANVDGHISAIAPKVSGNVVEVLVNDNQAVKAGDVLVRIDRRDFEARVSQAKAAVMQAESQLRTARTVVPWTNETTQSGATAASAQLADAEAELERARIGAEQAAGSELAYAEANVRARHANHERAQADLARMKPLIEKNEISRQQYDSYVAAARVAESEWQASQEKLASARNEAAATGAKQ